MKENKVGYVRRLPESVGVCLTCVERGVPTSTELGGHVSPPLLLSQEYSSLCHRSRAYICMHIKHEATCYPIIFENIVPLRADTCTDVTVKFKLTPGLPADLPPYS